MWHHDVTNPRTCQFSAVCLTVFPFEFRPRTFTIGFYGKIISELMILECSFPLRCHIRNFAANFVLFQAEKRQDELSRELQKLQETSRLTLESASHQAEEHLQQSRQAWQEEVENLRQKVRRVFESTKLLVCAVLAMPVV